MARLMPKFGNYGAEPLKNINNNNELKIKTTSVNKAFEKWGVDSPK